MAPIELLDLRASYSGGKIRMSWRLPHKPPDVVHVYPCTSDAANPQLIMRGHIEKKLKDCNDGLTFDVISGAGSDVKKTAYCVFLANPGDDVPETRILQSLPNCFVSVVTGEARISYDIKKSAVRKRPWDGRLFRYQLWVQSSAEIESGLLGYTYYFHGKEISLAFPGAVPRGVIKYPPLYIPNSETLAVGLIGGGNTDVSIIQQRLSWITRLFTCKKYID